MDTPSWGEITPIIRPKPKTPGVRRGTTKRRGRAIGMHMSDFWRMDDADRQITYDLSKAGRRD